jgi:hypothetical protein
VQRTTLLIPPELKGRAERRAKALGVSFGQLVRSALEASLREGGGSNSRDALFADDAVFRGPTPTDVASEHDRYLYGDS